MLNLTDGQVSPRIAGSCMEVNGSWKRVLVALRATVACYDVDATENRVVSISMGRWISMPAQTIHLDREYR